MRALRLHGKEDLRLDEVDLPVRQSGDVLVQVSAAAVCGSDYRTYATGTSGHGLRLPRIMGHEIFGHVIELDSDISTMLDLSVGDAVVVGAIAPCGVCAYCVRGRHNLCMRRDVLGYQYDGGFAEYVLVPRRLATCGNLVKVLPTAKDIPPEHLALAEPLSCAINAQEISQVTIGDVVVVIGAGPLGLLHIQLAKQRGAILVISVEPLPSRQRAATAVGADIVVSGGDEAVTKIWQLTDGYGAHVAIVAAPSPEAIFLGLSLLARGGRLNIFGGMPKGKEILELDVNHIHYNEIIVQGTSDSAPSHLRLAVDLIARGLIRLDQIVTDVVPLADGLHVFAHRDITSSIKTVLVP